jgi:hypothetical protein
MQITIDWVVQIAITLLVGGGSAWIAGKFGVRRALEQTRGQRAFEKQLAWYEDTIGVALDFEKLMQTAAIGAREHDPAIMKTVMDDSERLLPDFARKVNQAVVFSKRDTYLLVKRLCADIAMQTNEISRMVAQNESRAIISERYESQAKVAERIAFELARSVRAQLRLEEITQEDFDA